MSDDLTPSGAAAVRLALKTAELRRERDELAAKVARVEALAEKWDCSLRAAVPCIELDGATFPNGAEFTRDMWCHACRLRDVLRGDA